MIASSLAVDYVFNQTLPDLTSDYQRKFTLEEITSLPYLKYVHFSKALSLLPPYFHEFLSHFPVKTNYKYCLVDVKPQALRAREPACLPRWHIDIVDNPLKPGLGEDHFIFAQGLDAPTNFLATPLLVNIPDDKSSVLPLVQKAILEQAPLTMKITEGNIYHFTRNHLHCCSQANNTGWRLFVRVTYTNLLRKEIVDVHNDRNRL